MTATGRLVAVVGPSGVGKDTLIDAARAALPHACFPRRVITRPESAGGEPYQGVTNTVFDRMEAAGAFAITWPAHGLRYAIPAGIDAALGEGRLVIFNGSRAAIGPARARYPHLRVIAITASKATLAERLAARGRETAEDIAHRLVRADLSAPAGAVIVDNGGALADGVAAFLAALSVETGTGG